MENKTFEQMMTELEQIVQALEKGNLSLDEALKNYQLGIELSTALKKKLEEAKQVIEIKGE